MTDLLAEHDLPGPALWLELTETALVQDLPVSVVKIDGSFVQALGRSAQSSLVAAVQHMATDLGLRTVAEGVETAEQEAELRQLGCDLVQGYRFGHPAPDAGVARLATRRPPS